MRRFYNSKAVGRLSNHISLTNMLYQNYFQGVFIANLGQIIDDLIEILRRFL
jgi:hypothetical protein